MSSEQDFARRKAVIKTEMPTGPKGSVILDPEHPRMRSGKPARVCPMEGECSGALRPSSASIPRLTFLE